MPDYSKFLAFSQGNEACKMCLITLCRIFFVILCINSFVISYVNYLYGP